jgi:hypothetical protein
MPDSWRHFSEHGYKTYAMRRPSGDHDGTIALVLPAVR